MLTVDVGAAGVLEAADLVKAGIATRVAVFSDPLDPVDLEFKRRGFKTEPNSAPWVRMLANLGVPDAEQIPLAETGTRAETDALPAWCEANSPFHSTIAFGFLTLSMLTALSRQALGWAHDSTVETGGYAINYGLDRVRFVAPVPVNSRIRARFVMLEARDVRPGERINKFGVTVEIEGQERPALVAEWLGLWVSGEGHTRIEEKHG